MDQRMLMMLPGIQPDELYTIQDLTKGMTEQQQQQFFMFYQGKRKEQQTLLIMAVVGFFGVAGIHRFIVGDTLLGILYLFTLGFCGVGTIIDIINIRNLTTNYNRNQAVEAAGMVRMLHS